MAPRHFGRIEPTSGIGRAVSGTTTSTRRSKTCDNLILDRTAATEDTGRWNVPDPRRTFGLPLDEMIEVSDHNPAWTARGPWVAKRIVGR